MKVFEYALVHHADILTTLCLTLVCIPPNISLMRHWHHEMCAICTEAGSGDWWRNGFEWVRRASHSLETGVSFTPQIKLHYLHVIRGTEVRRGYNDRPNDGHEIVRANTQHCGPDYIYNYWQVQRHTRHINSLTNNVQVVRDSLLVCRHDFPWQHLCISLNMSEIGGWIPCVYYSREYAKVCVSWCILSVGVCVRVSVCECVWVEVTPLRELCPLSCCIYIEISLFVQPRPTAWQAGGAPLIAV